MKKPLRLLAFCIAILATSGTLLAQCGTFYDGFEAANFNNWSPAGGTYTRNVTTTSPAVGSYAFEQTGSSSHAQGSVANFTPSQPTSVSYWAKTSSFTNTGAYFVIGDASTPSNFGIFFGYFSSNGNIRIYSSPSSVFQTPFQINTWYHIELRNINWTNKTYDIYVNNVLGQANFPFRSQSSTNVDRIYLYNLSNLTASYDDITVGGVPINLSFNSTGVSCPTDSNGTASVTPLGGTPNYSYVWSTGDTMNAISNLLPGTYAVTVTDSNACTGVDSVVVTSPPAIQSSTLATDALCNGDSSGTIDLTVSGGTPPYTYAWSNSATVEDPSGLMAGTYSVIITDSNNCQWQDTASIAEPTALELNPAVTQIACNGDSTGAIDLSPTGGTPGYSFTWNTSATSEDLNNLSAGTYTVFVSDSNGCSTGDVFAISEPTAIAVGAVVSPNTGGNSGSIDLTVAGGTPPYTFAWSNSASSEDLNNLADGTYTVTVTDSNGCTSTDTFVVELMIGVEPGQSGPEVSLHPNPTSGMLMVRAGLLSAGPAQLRIYDLQGQVLLEVNAEAAAATWEQSLDLNAIAAGVYLLSVEAQGQRSVRRLVKQ